MKSTELAQALHAGARVYGTCVVSPSPLWPSMIAGTGADFVFIDTEHVPLNRERITWMCNAFEANNLATIVRIPEPDPYRATAIIDGGASGVVAPYMETIEQVRALYGAIKLRPLKGERLRKALSGEEAPMDTVRNHMAEKNAGKLVVLNIESVPALDNLDAILAEPGIDAILVGPYDLSVSLGVPQQYESPEFDEAGEAIVRKAREHNVGVGFHYSEGVDWEIRWAERGANLIVHSSDIALVNQTLTADFKRFREALGDKKRGDADGGVDVI